MQATAQLPTFERLRPRLLDRLLELRGSLDQDLARCNETSARSYLAAVVGHLGSFVAAGDADLHRGFILSSLAQRTRDAGGPAAVVSTLVAIGDIAARVAIEQLGDDGLELAVTIARRSAVTARIGSELLAAEVSHRQAERDRALTGDIARATSA